MRKFDDLLSNTDELDRALTAVMATMQGTQRKHLEILYRSLDGEVVERYVGNRVQSETRNSCSRIGGQLSKFFKGDGPSDKMMWIGTVEQDRNNDERWVMRPQIRAALMRLQAFGPVLIDEPTMTEASSTEASQSELEQREARFVFVEIRPEQAAFRRAVFRASGGVCVVSGCPVPEALEAAHLNGRKWREGMNSAKDGILLRRDLHALYDSALLSIDAAGKVQIDQSVALTYGQYQDLEILTTATQTEVKNQAD